jgi:TP901 family phage tail tape measure protein
MAAINLDIGGNTRRLDRDIQKTVNRVYNINLRTKGDQPLGRITGQVNQFNKSLDASNARVIAFGASAGIIFGVQRAFSALVGATIEVQKSLQDINVILNVSAQNLQKFGSELFNIAKNTGQSFQAVAEAATEFSRQGLGVEETLKRTNEALILSRLSGLDAAKSVEALTAAVNSYANQAVTATEVVNKFANVDAAFAVSSADLAEALARVGSSAAQSGVSLNELIAIVTSAQQTTARGGAVIGNSFKTIFTRLQRGKVVDLLGTLGISDTTTSGELKSTIQLLQDLGSVYDTLGARQQAAVAEQVGGVFQINILKAALADLGKEYSIYSSALDVAAGTTDQAIRRNEELNKTYAAQLNVLQENARQIASAAGERLIGPSIDRLVGGSNTLLGGINESDGRGFGAVLGKGILDGLGQFISGPGLALIGGVLLKLFRDLGKFATGSVQQLLGLNTAATQQKDLQASITQILAKNPQLLELALKGEQGLNTAASSLLANLQKQTVELQKQAAVAAQLSKAFISQAGVRIAGGVPVAPPSKPGKAAGYIPNFAEVSQAIALGAPSNVQSVSGVGKIGGKSFEANNKEFQIPDFGGTGETAVIPKYGGGIKEATKMIARGESGSVLDKSDRNRARGFVPNFAKTNRDYEVTDGDSTKNFLDKKLGRLKGVDAAESWQKEGLKATKVAEGIIYNQFPNVESLLKSTGSGSAAYNRYLYDSDKLNKAIINQGLGVPDLRYGDEYTSSTLNVMKKPVGIWSYRNKDGFYNHPKAQQFIQQKNLKQKLLKERPELTKSQLNWKLRDPAYWGGGRYKGGSSEDIAKGNVLLPDEFKQSGKKYPFQSLVGRGSRKGMASGFIPNLFASGLIPKLAASKTMGATNTPANASAKASRKIGYLDGDVLKDPKNAGIVGPAMKGAKISNVADYHKYLGSLVSKARKSGQLKRFSLLYGMPGSGKSTMMLGGKPGEGGSKLNPRIPILTPSDIRKVDEVIDTRASIPGTIENMQKGGYLSNVDRSIILSSASKESQKELGKRRSLRDQQIKSGVATTNFGRTAGTSLGSPLNSSLVEAASTHYLGPKRTKILDIQRNFKLKPRAKENYPQVEEKKIGLTFGAFAPSTKGHLENMRMAETMGIKPKDFVALISRQGGKLDKNDPHSWRTAQFSQNLRAEIAKKTFDGANIAKQSSQTGGMLPKIFDVGDNKFIIPKSGSLAFLGDDKGSDSLKRYSEAGYQGVVGPRTEGVSGTDLRKAIFSGDVNAIRKLMTPEASRYVESILPQLQARNQVFPEILNRVDKKVSGNLSGVMRELAKYPARMTPKYKEANPDIVKRVYELRAQRDKLQAEAQSLPTKYIKKLGMFPSKYGRFADGFIPNFAKQKTASKNAIDLGNLDTIPNKLGNKVVSLIYPGLSDGYSLRPATANYLKQDYRGNIPVAGINQKTLKSQLPDLDQNLGNLLVREANQFGQSLGGTNFLTSAKELPNFGAAKGAVGVAFEAGVQTLLQQKIGRKQNAGIDFRNITPRLRSIFNGAPGMYDAKSSPDLTNEVFKKLLNETRPGATVQKSSGQAGKDYIAKRSAAVDQLTKEGVRGSVAIRQALRDRFGIVGKAAGFIPNFAAIQDAVSRERAAGVPSNQIYLAQEKALTGANPMGIGVFNKRDEPTKGSRKDAMRSKGFARGYIPNFAETPESSAAGIGTVAGALVSQLGILAITLQGSGRDYKESLQEISKSNVESAKKQTSAAREKVLQEKDFSKRPELRKEYLAAKSKEKASARVSGSQKLGAGVKAGGFGLGIAAPILAQTLSQAIPQETKTGRVAAAGVGSLGNIGAAAATGAVFGPVGAAVGLAAGALLEIPNVVNQFTSDLPELTKSTQKAQESLQQINDSGSKFLQSFENYNKLLNEGADPKILQKAQDEYTKALYGLTEEQQKTLTSAANVGNLQEAYSKILEEATKRKAIEEFGDALGTVAADIADFSSSLDAVGFFGTGKSQLDVSTEEGKARTKNITKTLEGELTFGKTNQEIIELSGSLKSISTSAAISESGFESYIDQLVNTGALSEKSGGQLKKMGDDISYSQGRAATSRQILKLLGDTFGLIGDKADKAKTAAEELEVASKKEAEAKKLAVKATEQIIASLERNIRMAQMAADTNRALAKANSEFQRNTAFADTFSRPTETVGAIVGQGAPLAEAFTLREAIAKIGFDQIGQIENVKSVFVDDINKSIKTAFSEGVGETTAKATTEGRAADIEKSNKKF